MSSKKRFAEVDHSGDIGLEAWGVNLADLLQNLTAGLFTLMYHGEVRPVSERQLTVASESVEDLVVDWLGEVIASVGANGELYHEVRVEVTSEFAVLGVLKGEKADEAAHQFRFDVKAATYHELVVREENGGLYARVIFDL